MSVFFDKSIFRNTAVAVFLHEMHTNQDRKFAGLNRGAKAGFYP